jgi:PKD repeat protein
MILEGAPPIANFSFLPEKPIVAASVLFNDSSVPGNGTILWRFWNFGDSITVNTTDQAANHAYANLGNYTVTLSVFDSFGFTDSFSRIVTVVQYPLADFTYFPEVPVAAGEVTFNASSSVDPDGSIIMWMWNFSDGSPSSEGQIITHIFHDVGEYNVTLTVQDNHGLEDSMVRTITVYSSDQSSDWPMLLALAMVIVVILVCVAFIWRRRAK